MLPPFVDRTNYHRRLEPFGNVVLHGAGQDPGVGRRYDPSAFRSYWHTMSPEIRPTIYMSYVPLKADMPAYFNGLRRALSAYDPYQIMPQIGLYMNGEAQHGEVEPHYDHEVAAGQFDAQIDAFCKGLQQLGVPTFVRIGFEFNGPWNGYEPETYKASWIRITSVLRAYHLTDVATVWCYCPLPSAREEPDNNRIDKEYLPYYPGDKWVDWWSIDLFSPEMFSLENTRWFMEDARARGFPVMIGESTPRWVGGVPQDEAAWNAWFAPYFAFIRSQPNVKAFCYINWNWENYPEFKGWGDARIGTNDLILDRYTQELRQDWYRHAVTNAR